MNTKRTAPQATTSERPSTEAQPMKGTWIASQKLAILAEYETYPAATSAVASCPVG